MKILYMVDVAKDLGLMSSNDVSKNIILTISPHQRTMSDASDWNQNRKITYSKENYLQVQREINDIYYDEKDYFSSAMDILASYIKGQKIIYMESKFFCE